MAKRPIFVTKSCAPFYRKVDVEFVWSGGFAKTQSQKNIKALHDNFSKIYPDYKVLEISSKSMQEIGTKLSAFSLTKYVPEFKTSLCVENIYQGSKVFSNGGPYSDLYFKFPKEAKMDIRLKNSGELIGFDFNGTKYPLTGDDFTFYDLMYIGALLENSSLANELLKYDAFTDIIFTPNKSKNCQAKSAAIFKSLYETGNLGLINSLLKSMD